MAFWKIVGLEVRPRTPRSTHRSSSPEVIHPRFRLSSQGDWPCWAWRSCRRPMGGPPCRRRSVVVVVVVVDEGVEELEGAGDDVADAEAELLEHHRPGSRGPEAVDGHHVVGEAA